MKIVVLILTVCCLSVLGDNFENAGTRIVVKLFEDCSAADVFSSCLKKKAITFMDRLSRMEKLSLLDGIIIKRAKDVPNDEAVKENQLNNTLHRSVSAQDDFLNTMLLNKISKFIESRTIEITMPNLSLNDIGQGRKEEGFGDFGGGGGHGGGEGFGGGGDFGGGKGGKKGSKGMMGGLMMAIAAKLAALVPVAIAGLFLLAGKALITAKIALLISGIIAIKKLLAAKQAGNSQGSGWQSSGHGSGWQSVGGGGGGGGGGWDKRSISDSHHLAYKAHSPK